MKIVLLATLLFTTHALCPRAHAVSPRQVIKWATSRMEDDEILRRVVSDKRTKKVTIQQISDMRMAGVPESVIDYMANINTAGKRPSRQPKSRNRAQSSTTGVSAATVSAAARQRLTIALATRLATEHRDSLSAFVASLAETRGQLAFTLNNDRILSSAKVTAEQLLALRDHNSTAPCLYGSDCAGGSACDDGQCSSSQDAKGQRVSPAFQPNRQPSSRRDDSQSHRFGNAFAMCGLALTRPAVVAHPNSGVAVAPTPSDSDEQDETEWNANLALRVAYVTQTGSYVGGSIQYDSTLPDGAGNDTLSLLLGGFMAVSDRYPIFLDLRSEVSREDGGFDVRAALGISVALGEEHPIFLHAVLMNIGSAGATSPANVSMGFRYK